MAEEKSYFLPYQESWINDESPLKIAEKSRRVGFTYASSYRMFHKCLTRKNFTQWVSSRDMLTAQELIRDYIAKWAKIANLTAKGLYGEGVEVIDPEKNITAFVATFPATRSRIVSLSSTPEAFAGKGGDVFLDEADLHKDSAALIDMAYPCIMWGGQLEIVSAYRINGSKETPFAKMVAAAKKDNPQNARLHRVTIHDAISQGLVEKINEQSGRNLTREEFLRQTRSGARTQAAWESQFECKVQDAGGKLIPIPMIAACELDEAEIRRIEEENPNAPRFAGYDVARHKHASAYQEWIKLGVTLVLVRREIFHDVDFATQEKFLKTQMARRERPIIRLAMDATGLGMQMAENMARAFPGRVDQVNLESHRRHECCMLFKDAFEQKHALIPAVETLREDFNAPTIVSAANGAIRVHVPEFENAEGETSHADEFMAGVLAHSAADAGGVYIAPFGATARRDIDTRSVYG